MKDTPRRILRRRRVFVALAVFTALIVVGLKPDFAVDSSATVAPAQTNVLSEQSESQELARDVLDRILVRGRAPKTGYARDEFGDGWGVVGGCDMRNIMLARGMQDVVLAEDGCVVLSGTLNDPYTSTVIEFVRGNKTSNAVQIDHVVALSDAWQKGAQSLSSETRIQFANDPLNLLAVDGPANQEKGDSDAASWLPPNKVFRCPYVARQIAVKEKYGLWVTEAEKSAMKRVLNGCNEQRVPSSS